ncbi:MAG: UDP-glucose 4-epimerase GalE [Phycisphaerae bacterium]|nr:MAG: UDP-glucose 4-epimerase GalE [Phycisphaerae bacterium]
MTILVTGGAGYIGSHAVQRLLRDGVRVVSLDNEFRGHAKAMSLLAAAHPGRLTYVKGDILDSVLVRTLIDTHGIDAVMHFAAHAYVGESVQDPLTYYRNNVTGLGSVLEACEGAKKPVARFVFSSSCSTYGQPPAGMIPVREECPQDPVSPYGRTKLIGEWMLRDFAESRRVAGKPFACTFLRYFNVCGCDRSGLLGEDHAPETHLIPVVLQAALGQRPHVGLFGTDYPTPDGTCIRDYVHVEDLVDAHVRALGAMKDGQVRAYNVGIGKGYSVRQIIEAVRAVTKREIKVVEQARRPGDPPEVFNDPTLVTRELGWKPGMTDLHAIIDSAWRWMVTHPKGYAG